GPARGRDRRRGAVVNVLRRPAQDGLAAPPERAGADGDDRAAGDVPGRRGPERPHVPRSSLVEPDREEQAHGHRRRHEPVAGEHERRPERPPAPGSQRRPPEPPTPAHPSTPRRAGAGEARATTTPAPPAVPSTAPASAAATHGKSGSRSRPSALLSGARSQVSTWRAIPAVTM